MATKTTKSTKTTKAKKPAKTADAAKLAAELQKIQAQVSGKELARIGKAVERSQDELENFKDWTRTYFDEIISKFDLLATEQARMGGKAPAASASPRPAGGKELARVQEELAEIRQWISSLDEKYGAELATLRHQVNEARELAHRAAALPAHHGGHHGVSPEVL
jgi:hypothetical protein